MITKGMIKKLTAIRAFASDIHARLGEDHPAADDLCELMNLAQSLSSDLGALSKSLASFTNEVSRPATPHAVNGEWMDMGR